MNAYAVKGDCERERERERERESVITSSLGNFDFNCAAGLGP